MLTRAPAYVNHGRWVVDCPMCKMGWMVKVASPLLLFDALGRIHERCSCGYDLAVQFPGEYDAINSALAERKHDVNRNWYPHESVIDLLAQTLEREEV